MLSMQLLGIALLDKERKRQDEGEKKERKKEERNEYKEEKEKEELDGTQLGRVCKDGW